MEESNRFNTQVVKANLAYGYGVSREESMGLFIRGFASGVTRSTARLLTEHGILYIKFVHKESGKGELIEVKSVEELRELK